MKRYLMTMTMVAVALAAVGCADQPTDAIQAVDQALTDARSSQATDYAAESLTAAEDVRAQLDAELKAQEEKFALFRSYDKAEQLAADAQQAAEQAKTAAVEGRERAHQQASELIAELRTTVDEVKALVETAPRGKGSEADLAVLQSDVSTIEQSMVEMDAAFQAERYNEAIAIAEAARTQLEEIRATVQQAIDARAQASTRRG